MSEPRPDPPVEDSVEEQEETEVTFLSDDEANAARLVGLKFYNDGQYGDALDIQYAVVRHFTTKYGLTNARCGLYYLDYGYSQLRMIQSRDSSSAAVAPLDNESLETCFVNLDTARVCFQKQDEDDEEVQVQLAEVRNAIAQVHVEQEDFDSALQEYENEIIIYKQLEKNPQPRKLISAMYGMADCYMKECDFAEAELRFQAVIDEIAKLPAGTVDSALTQELVDLRDEAREMKDGKFKALQEIVRQQFLPEDQEVAAPQEVLAAQTTAVEGQPPANPFLSSMPGGEGGSMRSMPLALTSPLPPGENSNSQSVSLFFPQGNSRSQLSNSGPVHQAQVRKKAKAPVASVAVDADEPVSKKARVEA